MAKLMERWRYNRFVERRKLSRLSVAQKALLIALIVVVGSLSLLTLLQYRSLTEIEDKTKVAYRESLRQQSGGVEREVRSRLQGFGELLQAAQHIELKQNADGEVREFLSRIKNFDSKIDRVFLFSDCGCADQTGPVYFHTDEFRRFGHSEIQNTPHVRAVLHAYENARVRKSYLGERRILFSRVECSDCGAQEAHLMLFFGFSASEAAKHPGFVGLAIRESQLAPELFSTALVNIDAGGQAVDDPQIALTIADDLGRQVFGNSSGEQRYMVEQKFSPPLEHWTASLGYKGTDIDQLTKQSFRQGMALTGLILVLLIAGCVLLLHVARREIRFAESKSAFVANISHELRTPLAMIRLFAEMMEGNKVTDEEKRLKYYRVINTEASRLSSLVERVLDFTSAEAGRKIYHLTNGDVGEIVEEVVETCNLRFQHEGFQLICFIERPLPTVLVDRDAFMQAVLNLVDNAVKYSGPRKQVSVAVSSTDSHVEVVVADNGYGIPASEHGRVFERFYRIGQGLVHDVKGSGLGLSLVKHIVDGHGGNVRLESEPGKGSKFIIAIPVYKKAFASSVENEIGEPLQIGKSVNS